MSVLRRRCAFAGQKRVLQATWEGAAPARASSRGAVRLCSICGGEAGKIWCSWALKLFAFVLLVPLLPSFPRLLPPSLSSRPSAGLSSHCIALHGVGVRIVVGEERRLSCSVVVFSEDCPRATHVSCHAPARSHPLRPPSQASRPGSYRTAIARAGRLPPRSPSVPLLLLCFPLSLSSFSSFFWFFCSLLA